MLSIERVYKRIAQKKHMLGSYICLAQTVKGKNFSRKTLIKGFKKCVSESEYDATDTKALIDHLEYLTKRPEEGEF